MTDLSYLKGVWNITPTPFNDDGSVDDKSIQTLVDFNVNCGVDGLTILGVLGEAGKVTDAERERIIAKTIEASAGRLPICVGTSHAATDPCITYSVQAQRLGAKALMVAPPRLARPNEAAIRRHYEAVAKAVDIPIVVQDHPPSSGLYMSAELLAAISAEVPHCQALKLEDDPTPPKMRRVLALNPKAQILGALGAQYYLEELRAGALGTMTGFGFPDILVQIYKRWASGDQDGAAKQFYHISTLARFENQQLINLALRKHIYWKRGAIASAKVRAPASPLDEGTIADLEYMLKMLGLELTPQ